jgi:hypothetical protein
MWLFKRKTPAEMLRENKRMIDKAIRELDRERTGLQNQEKKTIVEIKRMAKDGQMVRGETGRGDSGGCGPATAARPTHAAPLTRLARRTRSR